MASGVRAEWHLADMAEAKDPFGDIIYSGATIDLNGTEEELGEAVARLLWREGRLANTGLRCELKDSGQDCRTCLMSTLDNKEHRSRLCRLGKDQSTVEGRFNAKREARLAPLAALANVADEASEIGALPPDLAELLTQVEL